MCRAICNRLRIINVMSNHVCSQRRRKNESETGSVPLLRFSQFAVFRFGSLKVSSVKSSGHYEKWQRRSGRSAIHLQDKIADKKRIHRVKYENNETSRKKEQLLKTLRMNLRKPTNKQQEMYQNFTKIKKIVLSKQLKYLKKEQIVHGIRRAHLVSYKFFINRRSQIS